MKRQENFSSEQFLRDVERPKATRSYCPVPHGKLIDLSGEVLKEKGFEIVNTSFRTQAKGQVVQAVYNLAFGDDKEFNLMYAWGNSYDKSMKFKSAIGGIVKVCSNGMLSGDMANYRRKHSGTADEEIYLEIETQINQAEKVYKRLGKEKEEMKEIVVPEKRFLEVIGGMFFNTSLINTEQLNVIKHEYKEASFDYKADKDSLWVNYQHITHALKSCNPKDYIKNHQGVHKLLCDEFGIVNNESNLQDALILA